ncbi:MAG: PDZ domain-containing protein [Oscillospiraceae bacterium]|nr:PDZ domain-containing protein [Oscillospiraceae bacterium]
MKRKPLKIIALALALVLSLSVFAFAAEEVDYGKKYDEALSIYNSNILFDIEGEDYIRDTLVSFFEEDPDFFYEFMNRVYERHDRYSHYMAPQKYEQSYGNNNVLVGIGVTIVADEESGLLTIKSVTNGGPAAKAGLKAGDKFLSVDGIDVRGFEPAEAGMAVRGKAGTLVKIKVQRGEESLTFNVTRAVVELADIDYYITEDKIGYMQIKRFDGINTFIEFIEAYRKFRDGGVTTVIFDLRDNLGGSMDCFINMMDNIVPKKDVPYLMTWQAKPLSLKVFQTAGYGFEVNKFVILINENTASAAELLAGSLKDLGYGVVVGKTSTGKGMGQRHIETSTGDEAVVTVLDLKLPVSGSYDGIGIIPDYEVDNKITPYKLPRLVPLENKKIASKIKTANVKAIEQRLSLLGYFYGEPDDNWDNRTVFALNMFCRDHNLPKVTSTCSWELIEKIDEETHALEQKYVLEDTQLDRAFELAEEYAKSDKKAECIDIDSIDFRRE